MEYRRGSHSLYDFKYHLVWCTKYRYRVLTGQVGERARALKRQEQPEAADGVSGAKEAILGSALLGERIFWSQGGERE